MATRANFDCSAEYELLSAAMQLCQVWHVREAKQGTQAPLSVPKGVPSEDNAAQTTERVEESVRLLRFSETAGPLSGSVSGPRESTQVNGPLNDAGP